MEIALSVNYVISRQDFRTFRYIYTCDSSRLYVIKMKSVKNIIRRQWRFDNRWKEKTQSLVLRWVCTPPSACFLDGSKGYIALAEASNGFVVVLQCQQNIANVPTLEPSPSPASSPSLTLFVPFRPRRRGEKNGEGTQEGRYFHSLDDLISRTRSICC